MRQNKLLKDICLAGLMAAFVFVFTAFVKVPTSPVTGGYVHLGDGIIFLAAALLPTSFALPAAVIGASMADLFFAPVWTPATMVIKALTVLCFTAKEETLLCKRNYLALLPSALLCAAGYYLFEGLVWGNFLVPLTTMPASFVQTAAGGTLFCVVSLALDRMGFKKRFLGGKS